MLLDLLNDLRSNVRLAAFIRLLLPVSFEMPFFLYIPVGIPRCFINLWIRSP